MEKYSLHLEIEIQDHYVKNVSAAENYLNIIL